MTPEAAVEGGEGERVAFIGQHRRVEAAQDVGVDGRAAAFGQRATAAGGVIAQGQRPGEVLRGVVVDGAEDFGRGGDGAGAIAQQVDRRRRVDGRVGDDDFALRRLADVA